MTAGESRPVAVITGAGRGIGRAISLGLAAAHFDLVLGWHHDEAAAAATAREAATFGAEVVAVQGDVTEESMSTALVDTATSRFGRLDAWVNNAGVSLLAPLLDTSAADARRLMEVNYLGTFHGLVAAGRHMSEHGGGRIVNVASDLGVKAAPLLGAYSASKFAVVGLTQAAALELATAKVTVNAICPGTVETDMVLAEEAAEAALLGAEVKDVHDRLLSAVPAGRLCTGEDVAASVLFLVSDGAAYLTGQAICVNGGSILH